MAIKVGEFPLYPVSEFEAAVNAFLSANPAYHLVQVLEEKAGTGFTGRPHVTTTTIGGQQVQQVRTNVIVVFST